MMDLGGLPPLEVAINDNFLWLVRKDDGYDRKASMPQMAAYLQQYLGILSAAQKAALLNSLNYVHTQGTDQALDVGGPNQVTAAQLYALVNAGPTGVTSFNGRTGAVLPASNDYTPVQVHALDDRNNLAEIAALGSGAQQSARDNLVAETAGAAASSMAAHVANPDPHPQYNGALKEWVYLTPPTEPLGHPALLFNPITIDGQTVYEMKVITS